MTRDRSGASPAYAVVGIVVLLFGVWLGFIGYAETTTEFLVNGPQGPGIYEVTYQVTYPIPGVFLILGGIGSIVAGVTSAAVARGAPRPTRMDPTSLQRQINDLKREIHWQQRTLFRLDEALAEGRIEKASYQDIRRRRLGQIGDMQDRLVAMRKQLPEGPSREV